MKYKHYKHFYKIKISYKIYLQIKNNNYKINYKNYKINL